ncbi:hypothetical protein Droror1_Dr00026925 [Drosera rotundifolia]
MFEVVSSQGVAVDEWFGWDLVDFEWSVRVISWNLSSLSSIWRKGFGSDLGCSTNWTLWLKVLNCPVVSGVVKELVELWSRRRMDDDVEGCLVQGNFKVFLVMACCPVHRELGVSVYITLKFGA